MAWNYRTIGIAQQKVAKLNQNDSRNIQPRINGMDVIAEERRPTKKELAIYALHRMHKFAVSEGVPLLPMDTSAGGYHIPEELHRALQAWQNSGASLADSDKYLAGYIHTSHRMDELPHLPEKSGIRQVFKSVLYSISTKGSRTAMTENVAEVWWSMTLKSERSKVYFFNFFR